MEMSSTGMKAVLHRTTWMDGRGTPPFSVTCRSTYGNFHFQWEGGKLSCFFEEGPPVKVPLSGRFTIDVDGVERRMIVRAINWVQKDDKRKLPSVEMFLFEERPVALSSQRATLRELKNAS